VFPRHSLSYRSDLIYVRIGSQFTEDGDNMVLRNDDNLNNMTSQTRRPRHESPFPWRPQISTNWLLFTQSSNPNVPNFEHKFS